MIHQQLGDFNCSGNPPELQPILNVCRFARADSDTGSCCYPENVNMIFIKGNFHVNRYSDSCGENGPKLSYYLSGAVYTDLSVI